MFDEDGSLDPLLKFLLVVILILAGVRMLWKWLTQDLTHWLTVGVGGWISDHPWWSGLAGFAVLLVVYLAVRLVRWVFDPRYVLYDEAAPPQEEVHEPRGLTYRMKQLEAMTPTGFEQACADLLARDGFVRPRRVGGAGDQGADVLAWDDQGRKLVIQCKQYERPVGAPALHQFNGTARPVHQADVALIIGLNGFTQPAVTFANNQGLTLVGRRELKRWSHGEHLYSVLSDEQSLTT